MRIGQIVRVKKLKHLKMIILNISDDDVVTIREMTNGAEFMVNINDLQPVKRRGRSVRIKEGYKVVDGRCKETLWFRKHRVVLKPGRGYRCKYCDRTLSELRQEADARKGKR